MIDIPHDRASSAVAFAASMKHKMELLMKAGDVSEHTKHTKYEKIRPEVIEKYRNGHTAPQLSREYEVPVTTIRFWAKGFIKKPRFTPEQVEMIMRLYDEGLMPKAIALKMGADHKKVKSKIDNEKAKRGKTRTRELNR